jgi:hypothetical protein
MRRLSSGSVTSVQSSVFFLDDDDPGEGLSFLEMEEDRECLETREDILDGSVSVSEPDWGVVLVLVAADDEPPPFRLLLLLLLFPERVEVRLGVVEEGLLPCPAPSHSWSESSGW